ncbi:hypothetical protein OZY32_09860 [Aliarcobacter cryaerophilus]
MVFVKTLFQILLYYCSHLESLGYDAFKLEIKELGLLKKGFTIKQIKKVILEDNEIMNGYVQVSSFIVKEI